MQGEPVDHFFMVVSGEVEVVVTNEETRELRLARLGQGQFFGEVELTQGGRSIASVHGSSHGAELAILPRLLFFDLIDGSPLTRHAMGEIAATRLAENKRRKSDQ